MQPDLFGDPNTKPTLKHHEDAFLQEALEYIAGTYKGHYVGN